MGIIITVSIGDDWQPQFGTVTFPRDLITSPRVHKGQVYKDGGQLYRARVSGESDDWPEVSNGRN